MPDVHKLTNEEQATLRGMTAELAAIERTVASLESIGVDMSDQRARLESAKNLRSGLLQQFGQPMSPA